MITLSTTIEIKGKSPQQIYDWMLDLDDGKYKRWHREHLEWKTLKRTPDVVGTEVFFDEWIGRLRFRFRGKIAEAIPDRLLKYELKYPIPAYFSIELEPQQSGTRVIHTVGFGYRGLAGRLLDVAFRITPVFWYFKREMDRHAREEFTNLKDVAS